MLGESGWEVCGGEASDPSVMFFLQRLGRWRRECHAEGGDLETQLSINCREKAPRVNTGPNLTH